MLGRGQGLTGGDCNECYDVHWDFYFINTMQLELS